MYFDSIKERQQELLGVLFKKASSKPFTPVRQPVSTKEMIINQIQRDEQARYLDKVYNTELSDQTRALIRQDAEKEYQRRYGDTPPTPEQYAEYKRKVREEYQSLVDSHLYAYPDADIDDIDHDKMNRTARMLVNRREFPQQDPKIIEQRRRIAEQNRMRKESYGNLLNDWKSKHPNAEPSDQDLTAMRRRAEILSRNPDMNPKMSGIKTTPTPTPNTIQTAQTPTPNTIQTPQPGVLSKKASGDQSSVGTSSLLPPGFSGSSVTLRQPSSPYMDAPTPGSPIPTVEGLRETYGGTTPVSPNPTGTEPQSPSGESSPAGTEHTQGSPSPAGTGPQSSSGESTGFNGTSYRFDGENIYQPEADRNVPPRRTMSPISEYKKTPKTKGTPWIDSILNTLYDNKFAVGGGLGGALLGALAGGENKLLWSLLLGGLGAGAGYMFDRD